MQTRCACSRAQNTSSSSSTYVVWAARSAAHARSLAHTEIYFFMVTYVAAPGADANTPTHKKSTATRITKCYINCLRSRNRPLDRPTTSPSSARTHASTPSRQQTVRRTQKPRLQMRVHTAPQQQQIKLEFVHFGVPKRTARCLLFRHDPAGPAFDTCAVPRGGTKNARHALCRGSPQPSPVLPRPLPTRALFAHCTVKMHKAGMHALSGEIAQKCSHMGTVGRMAVRSSSAAP